MVSWNQNLQGGTQLTMAPVSRGWNWQGYWWVEMEMFFLYTYLVQRGNVQQFARFVIWPPGDLLWLPARSHPLKLGGATKEIGQVYEHVPPKTLNITPSSLLSGGKAGLRGVRRGRAWKLMGWHPWERLWQFRWRTILPQLGLFNVFQVWTVWAPWQRWQSRWPAIPGFCFQCFSSVIKHQWFILDLRVPCLSFNRNGRLNEGFNSEWLLIPSKFFCLFSSPSSPIMVIPHLPGGAVIQNTRRPQTQGGNKQYSNLLDSIFFLQ